MKGDSIHTFENGGKESGFFCMKLVSFLTQEKEANQLVPEQFPELWATRFNEAKAREWYLNWIKEMKVKYAR